MGSIRFKISLIFIFFELFIAYMAGLNQQVLNTAVLYFIYSSIILFILVFAATLIVPSLSIPDLEFEPFSLTAFINRYKINILLLLANFFIFWMFASVDGVIKKIVALIFYLTNIILFIFITIWHRVAANARFSYQFFTLMKNDPVLAAEYIKTNPKVWDIVIGLLPIGLLPQAFISIVQSKIINNNSENNMAPDTHGNEKTENIVVENIGNIYIENVEIDNEDIKKFIDELSKRDKDNKK